MQQARLLALKPATGELMAVVGNCSGSEFQRIFDKDLSGEIYIDLKFEKITFLAVFQLRNRFWTLLDGPLDLLDQYQIPKKQFEKKTGKSI